MSTEKKKGRGGSRPGAGRPKGSIERFTSGNLKHFRERYPIQPLDHMMNVINAPPRTKGVTDARRDRMAMAAAPYLHQRLCTLEPEEEPPEYSMDLTKLTDDELIAFERMLIKAHRPVVKKTDDPASVPPPRSIST
jgi:hypothetical protein